MYQFAKTIVKSGALALSATVLGCAGAYAEGAPEVTDIRFVGLPSAGSSIVWIAAEHGYFEDEGIKFEAQRDMAAGSVTDNLLSGSSDVVWAGISGLIQAASKGAPVSLIANVDYDTRWEILVQPDLAIETLQDLGGHSMAVISPNTYCVMALKKLARDQGLPEDHFSFVKLSPADQVAAFGAKRVDSACIFDPMRSQIRKEFAGKVIWSNLDSEDDNIARSIGGGLAVTTEFANKNPNTVAAIQRAITRAVQDAKGDPGAVYEALAEATKQDVEKLREIALPSFAYPPSMPDEINEMVDVMYDYGIIKERPDMKNFDRTAQPKN
ncbi:ABC transporter substrate-binding protein [Roseibium sp. M-1]